MCSDYGSSAIFPNAWYWSPGAYRPKFICASIPQDPSDVRVGEALVVNIEVDVSLIRFVINWRF